MNPRRILTGLILVPMVFLLGCQDGPREVGVQKDDTGLIAEAFALNNEPSVLITHPESFSYFTTSPTPGDPNYNPNHPFVNLTVQFAVFNWMYPASNKAVVFLLDGDKTPFFAITQSSQSNPVQLGNIPLGQHTLTACLATKNATTYEWDLLTDQVESACHSIIVKMSLVGCYPSVFVPAEGQYICNQSDPSLCCFDSNPCSVDSCTRITLPGGGDQYECRYGPPQGQCCQSEFECTWGQRCYSVDNGATAADDFMKNKCYECDLLSVTADAQCDDDNACTVDACGEDWMCDHAAVVGPQGEPCCQEDADCDDKDPCTVDDCANYQAGAGHGYCMFTSYQDFTWDQLKAMGYADPQGQFARCCVPGKELQYCDEHLVVVDSLLQIDACWNVQCMNNKCRYGQNPDPLCCNTAVECDDCAEFDPKTGACVKINLCTIDACVENRCAFEWNPFHPEDEDCCQHDVECDDEQPDTIDECKGYYCKHTPDLLYCDLDALPPVACPTPTNPCLTYACNELTKHCDATAVANCCNADEDCEDDSACTEDRCNEIAHQCEHSDIDLIGGKKCCDVLEDCYDGNVCTNDSCTAHQCRYSNTTLSLGDCASGKCCDSNDDLNGNGSADACEVSGACTPWTCVNHCCVPKRDLQAGQCISDLDCDDGNPYTWNVCQDCTCGTNPPRTCDESNPNCNDGNACTTDSCDFAQKLCKYVRQPNCCVQQSDCVPATPDPCTNYQCIASLHICQNTYVADCCTSDDDPKCSDFNDCTDDFCVNGKCRHLSFDDACCATNADCDDGRKCTQDACVDGSCVNNILPQAPDGTKCCTSDGACTDASECTQDLCIKNACANPQISGCCGPATGLDPKCDDGNPCTADWCIYGQCRNLPPNLAPPSSNIPEKCCVEDNQCKEDGNECTDERCVNGLCTSVPKEPCILDLPHCLNFNQGTWPPEFLGWKRFDALSQPSAYNWENSTKGPQGVDYHLRFNGLKYPLESFNAYLISPVFRTNAGGKQLFTDITVQWQNFLDLSAPEATNLSLLYVSNGNLVGASTLWGVSATDDLENEWKWAHHHQEFMPQTFQVAFNINALQGAPGGGTWNGAAHITGWDIDTLCICAGNAPTVTTPDLTFGLFLDQGETFRIAAVDGDKNNELSFELIGAPDFVTINGAGRDWQSTANRWLADLIVNPTDEEALGEHTFTLRISDGCLTATREVTIAVFLMGGYLVWVPEGVSPLHGQRIVEAFESQPDQVTAKRQWQTITKIAAYPDLNVLDGIFGCLGIKGKAHALTDPELALLLTFLDEDGRLYLEGGDAWYDNVPNQLQDAMRVQAKSGGSAKLPGPVFARNFLRSLGSYAVNQLPYNPSNPNNFWNNFNDRLRVRPHTYGRVLLEAGTTDTFATAISFCDSASCTDGDPGYRSLASSLPFGALENGAATRTDLMEKYLYFLEHGYPNCTNSIDCDDGQECTTDACLVGGRCAIAEVPNCVYCEDDRDCDAAFQTLDYGCHTTEVCKPIPGYETPSGALGTPIDVYVPGLGWQNPSVTSTITLGGGQPWEERNVYRVTAKLRIEHAYMGELQITLKHGIKTVTLKGADLTKFGEDYYFTIHEEWGRPAALGTMADYENLAIAGDWILTVTDTKPSNFKGGQLVNWSLFVVPDEQNCGGDGECNDGNQCTIDQCLGGFCKNSPWDCTDYVEGQPNLCTTDDCDPALGCSYTEKICDDGNDCSVDRCEPLTGDCTHEWPPDCHNTCVTHMDCGRLQYCHAGFCEYVPGLVYDSPLTGATPITDNGSALVLPLNIPAGSKLDSQGSGAEDRMIQKLRVKVIVSHEDVSDLEVTLTRGMHTYTLVALGSGSGAGQHWVFSVNDDVDFDVPADDLEDHQDGQIGGSITGDWVLRVQDRVLGDSGTLDGWLLFLVETHCFSNADCDDGSLCSQDACIDNPTTDPKELAGIPKVCLHNETGSACDDGDFCNGTEICHPNTGCVDGEPPLLDDGIACTADICDDFNDEVFHLPNDSYCNDDNPCTDDICDVAQGGCVNLPNTAGCDDGIYCTINDACAAGECAGTPSNSPPGCMCNTTPDCAIIINENQCAGSYVCNAASHTCVIDPATEVVCPDLGLGTPCALNDCDPSDGECKVRYLSSGVMCEDGDLCTINDLCNGAGQCIGVTNTCDDGYWCNGTEVCDPASGLCVAQTVPLIDDGVGCTIDVCDGENYVIYNFPDHGLCDNGIFCDGVEQCNQITGCVDGADPNCNDYNPCTADQCVEALRACDHDDRVQHCVWPCDGNHNYDAGDDDCGYDDACVGGAGSTMGQCTPICSSPTCLPFRSIQANGDLLNLAIPDDDDVNCLVRTLDVTLPANLQFVERVDARVQIAHPDLRDLRVSLKDPQGYTVRAWELFGLSNDDFANTFSMSWPDTHRPFCAFRGDAPSGTWTLTVCDVLPQSTGVLQDWTLYVKGAEGDTNLGDRCDNAIAISADDGNRQVTGSTTCAQEDHSGSCGGSFGKERVYRFNLASHKLLNATTNAGSNWVMYVKPADGLTCADATTSCAAAPPDRSAGASIVDLKLPPGTYYLFVDSNGDYGDFVVDMTFKTLLPNGGFCDHLNDCISEYCTDNTCCNMGCGGLCERCDGQATPGGIGDKGTCTPITSGLDPEDECEGTDSICGGVCNGSGDCYLPGIEVARTDDGSGNATICQRCDGDGDWEYAPHGTDPFLQCPNRTCSSSTLYYEQRCFNDETNFPGRTGTCDCYDIKYSVLGCQAGDPEPASDYCPNGYMCDPTDGPDDDFQPDDCRSSCTDQSHCQIDGPPDGWYCEELVAEPDFHACKERKPLGDQCNVLDDLDPMGPNVECFLQSGTTPYPCIDATCCNTTCGALCMRCDGLDTTHGVGDAGTCTFIADGNNPDVECNTDDKTLCGDGWCDGGGACDYHGTDVVCHAQTCGVDNNGADLGSDFCQPDGSGCDSAADWILFPTDYCDDAGYCSDEGYRNCSGGLMCEDTQDACKTTCLLDTDCARPFGSDCDTDGGVNYYCTVNNMCNPTACDNVMDATTNGSGALSSPAGVTPPYAGHTSLGGTPQGPGQCSGGTCATDATRSNMGFYPITRAKETPLHYLDP